MQKELDDIKVAVAERIEKLFMVKFDGNKRRFADAVGCSDKAIRKLLLFQQGMTLNFLLKIAIALDTTPSEILDGLELKTKHVPTIKKKISKK